MFHCVVLISSESPLIPSEQTSNGNGSAFDASEKKLDAGSGGTVVEGAEPPDDRCCLSRLCDFPASIFFIIGNEFCERFSYYGMKGVCMNCLHVSLHLHAGQRERATPYSYFSLSLQRCSCSIASRVRRQVSA